MRSNVRPGFPDAVALLAKITAPRRRPYVRCCRSLRREAPLHLCKPRAGECCEHTARHRRDGLAHRRLRRYRRRDELLHTGKLPAGEAGEPRARGVHRTPPASPSRHGGRKAVPAAVDQGITNIEAEDKRLPFTFNGFGAFTKGARFQYLLGELELACVDEKAARKRWEKVSKMDAAITSADYAYPFLALERLEPEVGKARARKALGFLGNQIGATCFFWRNPALQPGIAAGDHRTEGRSDVHFPHRRRSRPPRHDRISEPRRHSRARREPVTQPLACVKTPIGAATVRERSAALPATAPDGRGSDRRLF